MGDYNYPELVFNRMCKRAVEDMTTDQLKNLHEARPFKPFAIYLADETSVPVDQPELLFRTQGGRTAFVNMEGEKVTIIDLLLVTKLTFQNENGARRRRRG